MKNINLFYGIYILLTSILFIFLFPAFWIYTRITGKYQRHLKERLGIIQPEKVHSLSGAPRIWIHAVSLGEVVVAAPIIEALKQIIPQCSVILSTMTEHGREMAMETFKNKIPVIYAPIDFVGAVRKALSRIRPHVVVFLETEIWPTWLFECQRMGIKTALVNGRISVRSIGGYMRFRPFFREVLKNLDVFSMILEEDANRIKAMGAEPKRIRVNGNAKYEKLGSTIENGYERAMRSILNLHPEQKVFVAGSTREGEEEMVLDAYKRIFEKYPDTILIIVPRHIERTSQIASIIERNGFGCQLRTDLGKNNVKRTEKVVIINTFGELLKVYSISTIVFAGASLVPLGGQNPLEPAVWGKVVLYGPSMEDFLDAKSSLEAVGAGIEVSGPEMMAEKVIWFLDHPEALKKYGNLGKGAALKNQGAAQKHARVIAGIIKKG
jgi:3-deoxy-D-manno-octulosonic-acid transferase